MSNQSNSSSGIGFAGLLFIALLVLKLCKVIDWSWWYITMPLWIATALAVVLPLIIVGSIVFLSKSKRQPKSNIPTKNTWQERHERMMENQAILKNKNAKK